MKIIISGGGTGGHIFPALSIADKIKEKVPGAYMMYVGNEGGLEEKLAKEAGMEFKSIHVKGFIRKITFENIKRVSLALKAMKEAESIIDDFKPDVVIGTGGYVCGPVVKVAAKKGIFTAIHESNSFPGLTNRLLAKYADLIFIGMKDAEKYFKTKKEILYVGNPVRKKILNISRAEAREELDIPTDRKYILFMGGSGGSSELNAAFADIAVYLILENIGFLITSGMKEYLTLLAKLKDMDFDEHQQIEDFENDIAPYMAAADLVVCSAGAATLAEVTAMGKPCLVIPKTYTAGHHQEYNAKFIKNAGAGDYINDKDLNGANLKQKLEEMLSDPDELDKMSTKSKALYNKNAAEAMANIILDRLKLRENHG